MTRELRAAVFGRRFVRHLTRLLRVYWRSSDAKWGLFLLALAVLFELATVWGSVRVAETERLIMDGLAQRDSGAFSTAIAAFLGMTLLYLVVSVYRIYMRQSLEIRWRRALTAHYLERWIGPHAYLQAELHRGEMDNPDQRIQEDVRDFVGSALGLSLSLFAAVATLVSFGDVLWTLSRGWPLRVDGVELHVPGFMLWVALVYSLVSMWVTHRIGRPLVPINFDRLRFEADFRYGLTHFRDNAQAVALSRGEAAEREAGLDRFRHVVENWWDLIRAQRTLSLVTAGIGQANGIVPVLVAVPAYFAGSLTLGTIVQIRIAYTQVSAALAWFVYAYQEIARWRANVERLSTFSDIMDTTARELDHAGIRVAVGETPELRLTGLRVEEPNGRVLIDGADATVREGERVAITGPSGTGKTLLLRAIAGVWPFGAGRIDVPGGRRMLFVSQWPYLPIGTLRAAASYPAPEGTFDDARIVETLGLLGLERFAPQLAETAPWEQLLSPHEQQRLALARVLLHAPDWLFLDKATSALDEATEEYVYALLAERLPRATVVTIAHRPAVAAHHAQHWTVAPSEGRIALHAA